MNATEILAGAALGVSGIALYLSIMAAWPQIKEWAESMRDLVLWIALVSVVGGIGYLGWTHYEAQRRNATAPRSTPGEFETSATNWQR